MEPQRRQFIQRLVLFPLMVRLAYATALSGLSLAMTGCWFGGNVFNDILNWVPVGEATLNSILAVLTGNGVIVSPALQTIVSLIEAGFNALTAAIKEYQSTTPPPVGTLAKIQTAFRDVVDQFKAFFASLNVNGGLLAIIVGLGQIIFSTIAAFLNQLPAKMSLHRTVVLGDTVRISGSVVSVIPKARTRRAFKKDINSQLDQGPSVGVVIPKSAYLHVTFWERL
jgi:hypothetical protein